MAPRVIVSDVAKHHAYETALAAQKAGMLKRFYTSFYLKKNPQFSHKLITQLMPGSLKAKMTNRFHELLDENKVTSYVFPELLERINPLRNAVGHYNMMNFKCSVYDFRVSLDDLECDIFHGFEGAVLYSMLDAKKRGAITILDQPIFHHQTSREIIREEYERFGLKPPEYSMKDDVNIRRKVKEIETADHIFVPSQKIANDFIRYGKRKEQLHLVHYGFNPERFFPGIKKDKIFRVLFVGIVGFRKGVIYLLEAFKQLQLKNAELLIISPLEKEFEHYFKRYEGLYRYIDFVPNNKIMEYYHSASVFVFPSLIEGSALSNYEAMACGLPVITTENAGSVVRDKTDGFIVPVRDIDALKEKILWLYENEDARVEMGRTAAEYVKKFTWDRYHYTVSCAYKRILAEVKNG